MYVELNYNNSPIYKWALTNEEIESNVQNINCLSSTTVSYNSEDSDTYLCFNGYKYYKKDEYISTECDDEYQYIGSVAGDKIIGRKCLECGEYELQPFDVMMINDNDKTYVVMTYYDGIIPDGAFVGDTDITSVRLGENIWKVGNQSFMNCSSLTSITLYNVTYFGYESFKNCRLQEINLQSASNSIGYAAFDNNQANGSLILPNNVNIIYENTFSNNNISVLHIPENIKAIYPDAFMNTPIEEIYIYQTKPMRGRTWL